MTESRNSSKVPRCVYRSLDDETHASELLRGIVRVSTLEWLRTTDRLRGDRDEATVYYEHGNINSNDDTPETRQVLANLASMGLVMEPGSQYLINSVHPMQVNHRPLDGYLYCTSSRPPSAKMERLFGNYCVRIADPAAFADAVGRALLREGLVTREYFYGRVEYKGRHYSGPVPIPTSAVFLGTIDAEHEAEYRFFWPPVHASSVTPVVIEAPDVGRLCSRFG